MSCFKYRQPPEKNSKVAAPAIEKRREALVIDHLAEVMRLQLLEETQRFHDMKFRVARFDAKIKPVGSRVDEALYVENGMVRLGQTIERQHAEHREIGRAHV